MEIDTHTLGGSESETDLTMVLVALLAGIAIGVVVLWTIETADAQPKGPGQPSRPFGRNGVKPAPTEEVGYRPPADLEVGRAQSTG